LCDLVFNFNYTKTASECIRNTTNWVDVIDIHGTIDEGEDSMIFGYGDDIDENYVRLESFNHSEFLRHFKSHRYSQNNLYERLLHFLEYSAFEVHLIGHSCGLSDRTMLKTIFEHDQCESILTYHYRDGDEAKADHIEKDINVSRHFDDKVKKRARFKHYDPSLRY